MPNVYHALVPRAIHVYHYSISAIVRQDNALSEVSHIGCGETNAPAIVETMHHSSCQLKWMPHAVHGIFHTSARDELTHYRGTHWSILPQVLRSLYHFHTQGLPFLHIGVKTHIVVVPKAVIVAHHQGVDMEALVQHVHEVAGAELCQLCVEVKYQQVVDPGGA